MTPSRSGPLPLRLLGAGFATIIALAGSAATLVVAAARHRSVV